MKSKQSPITSVYRFFQEDWQAEMLVGGSLWLSTLSTCRAYENSEQGDPHEGYQSYNTGYFQGNGDDPRLDKINKHSGIYISPNCKDVTINNNLKVDVLQDAFVLCTTHVFSPSVFSEPFGKFCVEITDARSFFIATTVALQKKFGVCRSEADKVIYKERHFTGTESPPGKIGFVKPIQYEKQAEFRFLWFPKSSSTLKPFLLECPEVAHFCKRIA